MRILFNNNHNNNIRRIKRKWHRVERRTSFCRCADTIATLFTLAAVEGYRVCRVYTR